MGCRWTQVNYINLVDCISFFVVLRRTPMTMKITSTTTSTNRKLCSTPFPFSTSHTDQSIGRVLHLQHSFFFFFSVYFLFFWMSFNKKCLQDGFFFFFWVGVRTRIEIKISQPNEAQKCIRWKSLEDGWDRKNPFRVLLVDCGKNQLQLYHLMLKHKQSRFHWSGKSIVGGIWEIKVIIVLKLNELNQHREGWSSLSSLSWDSPETQLPFWFEDCGFEHRTGLYKWMN